MKGDRAAAIARWQDAADLYERLYGPDHPARSFSLSNQGVALLELGRLDEADAALDEALALELATSGKTMRTSRAPTTTWPTWRWPATTCAAPKHSNARRSRSRRRRSDRPIPTQP
jgi:tetratricopeptide (TPR) repeat protein